VRVQSKHQWEWQRSEKPSRTPRPTKRVWASFKDVVNRKSVLKAGVLVRQLDGFHIYFGHHSRVRRENMYYIRNQFDLLYSRRVKVQQEKHWSNAGYCKRKVHSHQSLCSHNLHPIYRTLLPTSCSPSTTNPSDTPMMLIYSHIVKTLICRRSWENSIVGGENEWFERRLDTTSRSASMSPTTSTTAGQARDDDVEETSDGSDDGCYHQLVLCFIKSVMERGEGAGPKSRK
jgi:hypothetical protein